MDEQREPRPVVLRVLLCLLASGGSVVVTLRAGSRPLDVALWAVLVPLVVATALALTPWAWRRRHEAHRRRGPVVVPDAAAAASSSHGSSGQGSSS